MSDNDGSGGHGNMFLIIGGAIIGVAGVAWGFVEMFTGIGTWPAIAMLGWVGFGVALFFAIRGTPQASAGRVEFIPPDADQFAIANRAYELLKDCRQSLHYWGGMGMLGSSEQWRAQLLKLFTQNDLQYARYICLIDGNELQATFAQNHPLEDRKHHLTTYAQWLRTQASAVRDPSLDNQVFDFPGAPIWQFGMHILVFDEKHILIGKNGAGGRSCTVLMNHPEIGKQFAAMMEKIQRAFDLQPVSAGRLEALAQTCDTAAQSLGSEAAPV